MIALSSVAFLAVASVGVAYSPLFALERVRVIGTQELDAAAIEAALGDQIGKPLPLIDENDVQSALKSFPRVETFALEARPPHEIVVRLVERTPVGVLQVTSGYALVDSAGVVLATSAEPPAGQPILAIPEDTNGDVLAAVGLVMRSLPDDLRGQVTEVSATTRNDVTLMLGEADTQVVWGSDDQSAQKAVNLAAVMQTHPIGSVAVYDVSSASTVVVR